MHVAFDLGAESGRAMVGRFDGSRLELEEVGRFPTRSVRLPDGLYWDALGLFAELTSALTRRSIVGPATSGASPSTHGVATSACWMRRVHSWQTRCRIEMDEGLGS